MANPTDAPSNEPTPEQLRIAELEKENSVLQEQVSNPDMDLDKLAPIVVKEYHNGAISYNALAHKYRCSVDDIRRMLNDRALANDSHEYEALIDAR
jgi:hypothetical protein